MFKPSKHEVIHFKNIQKHSKTFKNIQLRNSQQNLNLKSTNPTKTRNLFVCVSTNTDINKLNWRFNHIFLVITNRDFYCMLYQVAHPDFEHVLELVDVCIFHICVVREWIRLQPSCSFLCQFVFEVGKKG